MTLDHVKFLVGITDEMPADMADQADRATWRAIRWLLFTALVEQIGQGYLIHSMRVITGG